MPGGLDPTSLTGYVGFAAVKYVGYSISGAIFNNYYPDKKANLFLFGLVRTGIGIALGAVVGLIALVKLDIALYIFLLGLIPFRIAEWLVTLRFVLRQERGFQG